MHPDETESVRTGGPLKGQIGIIPAQLSKRRFAAHWNFSQLGLNGW